jgi:hypothetical protein
MEKSRKVAAIQRKTTTKQAKTATRRMVRAAPTAENQESADRE